jgi:hypothetical protein
MAGTTTPPAGTGTTPGSTPAPRAATGDSYAPLPGVEATVTPGKGYGTEATIRDTDKRNGKAKSLLNIPASRA